MSKDKNDNNDFDLSEALDVNSPKKDIDRVKKLLKEGKKAAKDLKNPPPPGDYNTTGGRGKKTKHKCSACGGTIESIYTVKYPKPIIFGPGGAGHWSLTKHRCMDCKLLFDL